MRKSRCGSMAIVVVLWAAGTAMAQNIPLEDPSFEQDQAASPSRWRLTCHDGAEGKLAWTTEAHSGRRALRIEKTNALGYVVVCAVHDVPAQPETSYEAAVQVQVKEHGFGSRFYYSNQNLDSGRKHLAAPQYSAAYPNSLVLSRPGVWHRHGCIWKSAPGTAAIQLRWVLSGNPAVVLLDDLELLANPKPQAYRGHGGTAEKPYNEQVARTNLARRHAEPAAVATQVGRPQFVVGSSIRTALVHQGAYGYPSNSRYAGFARAGIHLQTVTVQMGPNPSHANTAWKYPKGCEFKQLERDLLHAVGADAEVRVILQVRCDMPAAWCAEHPQDVWTAEDGLKWVLPRGDCHPHHKAATLGEGDSFVASYGSPAYRDTMAQTLGELGRFVATSDVGKLVVGFVIGGGNDGQFFDWSKGHELDHSEGHRHGFQAWLREFYGNDLTRLRTAWGDPAVTFDTAIVPGEAERKVVTPFLAASGPERRVADANRYAGIAPARLVKHFAQAIKTSIGRPVFSMCYYPDAVHGHGMNIYALSELLSGSDRMDSATAVQEYEAWRDLGGTGGTNACWGSYRLRGCVQVCEIDYRTYRVSMPSEYDKAHLGTPATAEGFRAQIRRDCGATASRGAGAWYYDMSGGWYDDPALWDIVDESRRIMDWAHRPEAPSPVAELAVFADEDAGWRTSSDGFGLLFTGTNPQRKAMNLSGVPYDLYLLDDIRRPDLPDYKAYLFLSSFTLNEKQQAAIHQRCRRPGRFAMFCGTPGLAGGAVQDAAQRAASITGIACELLAPETRTASRCRWLIVRTRSRGGWPARSSTPEKPDARRSRRRMPRPPSFGRFVQSPGQKPSHVIRRTDQGAVILAAGNLTPELVQNLAREAGIGTRGTPGQVTYVGCGVAVCHRVQPGKATVRFARPVDLLALDGQTVLARATTEWEPKAELLETDVVFYRPVP